MKNRAVGGTPKMNVLAKELRRDVVLRTQFTHPGSRKVPVKKKDLPLAFASRWKGHHVHQLRVLEAVSSISFGSISRRSIDGYMCKIVCFEIGVLLG
jgi:hypothetical protein